MNMVELEELFLIAKKIAIEVGMYQLEQSAKNFKIESKDQTEHNKVTEIDIESEKKIVSAIKSHFPSHDIIGEEGQYLETNSDYKWIIDPIDGTNNFIQRIPFWSVSIACAFKNETVMGVVYNPSSKDLYYSKKGCGAFKNKEKLEISKKNKIAGSLFATGFYYDRGNNMHNSLEVIKDILKLNAMGIRRFGAASLDMCLLAQGSLDAYWEHKLSVWDFAAAMLIVREAGGLVMDFAGNDKKLEHGEIVSSNPFIKNDLLEIINKSFK